MTLIKHRVQQIDNCFYPQIGIRFTPFWTRYGARRPIVFDTLEAARQFVEGDIARTNHIPLIKYHEVSPTA